MRFLILGAGGVGGYFGGRLAQAGADVTFLVRERRQEQLARDGLRIESPLGNATFPVQTVTASGLGADYDVIVLTCKAYDLASALDAIAPAMGPRAAVLPLLNGLAHLERLDARFGRGAVLGGTCMIDVTLRPDGVVHHTGTLQRIIYGERDGATSPRAEAIGRALGATTIDWRRSDAIELDLWEKLVFLSALAATTCLFRANVGEINAVPGGREAMERALAANIAIATRAGFAPRAEAMQRAHDRLTDRTGNWSASLLRDVERGGPAEIDHIVGWMLAKAREHGVDDTLLSLAYTHLKAYETRRDSGRL